MSNFKSKNIKELKNVNIVTLDKTHRNIMHFFTEEEAKLKIQTEKCKKLQEKINNSSFKNKEEERKSKEIIKNTQTKVLNLKKRKHKYILDNSNLIFEYFNIKKQTETTATSPTTTSKNADVSLSFNKQRIHDFFNKSRRQADASSQSPNADSVLEMDKTKPAITESSIVAQYLSRVNETYLPANVANIKNNCMYCKQGQLLVSDDDGYLVCNQCAASVTYIPENEKQSYKDPPKEIGTFLYDRSNHFKEICAQFQAKETTYIADEVIEKCRLQIKKQRLTNEQLTYYKMRDILRNLGYDSKLYEHIPFIKNKLGIPPPVFSRELEMKLYKMFDETLVPFSKHQDETRCNYIHYYFALYKMYELLGETKYAKDIPMLKEPGIFVSQDEIWKNICAELNWKFIPTSFNIVGGDV